MRISRPMDIMSLLANWDRFLNFIFKFLLNVLLIASGILDNQTNNIRNTILSVKSAEYNKTSDNNDIFLDII